MDSQVTTQNDPTTVKIILIKDEKCSIIESFSYSKCLIETKSGNSIYEFDNVNSALDYIYQNLFTCIRVILSENNYGEFFQKKSERNFSREKGVIPTYVILIENANKDKGEQIFAEALPLTECSKKCYGVPAAKIKCLQLAYNKETLESYCSQANQKQLVLNLALGLFKNYPEKTLSTFKEKISNYIEPSINLGDISETESTIRFIKSNKSLTPDYFSLLPIPKIQGIDPLLVKIFSVKKYAKDNSVQEGELLDWLDYLNVSEICWKDYSRYHYLLRLWTKENKFSLFINKALAENNENDILYLRYVILDLIGAAFNKVMNFYSGKLFRGVNLKNNEISELHKLQGKNIFLNFFLNTSKDYNSCVSFNTIFEIETISAEANTTGSYHSNIDLTAVSMNPSKGEVLYPPMTIFLVEKVEEVDGKCMVYMKEVQDSPSLLALISNLAI